jgi:hypothetical protein
MTDEILVDSNIPARYARNEVALRIALVVALSVLGAPAVCGFGLLYLVLPIVAAVVISSRGNSGYLETEGARVVELLRWWTAFVGYLLFLGDRFPLQRSDYASVRISGAGSNATVGSALLRLLTSLPVVILLVPLWWLAGVLAVIAAILVLASETVPAPLVRYFAFVTALQARLLVYHASLTDRYPLTEAPTPHAAR